jgi:hypothetical protein
MNLVKIPKIQKAILVSVFDIKKWGASATHIIFMMR